jgi:SAM-dependent methyltransferase
MKDNREQIEYWNGEGGRRWVEQDHGIDALIRPIGEATLEAAAPRAGERALDVGCGCGNPTLSLARRIGPRGQVLGVDVSEPMLALARERLAADRGPRATVEFLRADAAEHPFSSGGTDLLFSRFGVMFFADPVPAFANLRRALGAGGRLAFCCWRAMKDNELMVLPLKAALAHLPPPEPVPPETPGPFAFADRERVRGILGSAGLRAVAVEPLDVELHYGAGLAASEIARRLLDLGPASRLLADADAGTRARVEDTLQAAIAPRCGTQGISLTACCWLVTARA